MRASLDIITGAWWIYNTGNTKVDSFHDLLKKMKIGLDWHPIDEAQDSEYWKGLLNDYDASDINWLSAFVGREKGQSLRDIAVHRSALEITLTNDSTGRDAFAIRLDKQTIGYATDTIIHLYENASIFIDTVKHDIETKEFLQNIQLEMNE